MPPKPRWTWPYNFWTTHFRVIFGWEKPHGTKLSVRQVATNHGKPPSGFLGNTQKTEQLPSTFSTTLLYWMVYIIRMIVIVSIMLSCPWWSLKDVTVSNKGMATIVSRLGADQEGLIRYYHVRATCLDLVGSSTKGSAGWDSEIGLTWSKLHCLWLVQETEDVVECGCGCQVSPSIIAYSAAMSACDKGEQWQLALSFLHELSLAGIQVRCAMGCFQFVFVCFTWQIWTAICACTLCEFLFFVKASSIFEKTEKPGSGARLVLVVRLPTAACSVT